MLSIEKVRNTHSITLKLRPRERTVDQGFRRALALAVIIHLFAIVFVKIRTAPNDHNAFAISPAIVDTDIGYYNQDPLAATVPLLEAERGALPRYIVEPQPPTPTLPTTPTTTFLKNLDIKPTPPAIGTAFVQLERLPYQPNALVLPFEENYTPITMVISGPLASGDLLNDGLSTARLPRPAPLNCQQRYLRFRVQVDNATGEIFWFEQQNTADFPALTPLVDSIISKIRFEKRKSPFVTTGTLELTFTVDDDDDTTKLLKEIDSG